MSSSKQYNKGDNSSPVQFENLEERLLLTTLMEGQYFIYQNVEGDSVRIQLNYDKSGLSEEEAEDAADNPASVELFSLWRPMRATGEEGGEGPITDEMLEDGLFRSTYQLHHLVGLRFDEGEDPFWELAEEIQWTGQIGNEIWDSPVLDDPFEDPTPYDWGREYITSIIEQQADKTVWRKYSAGGSGKYPFFATEKSNT